MKTRILFLLASLSLFVSSASAQSAGSLVKAGTEALSTNLLRNKISRLFATFPNGGFAGVGYIPQTVIHTATKVEPISPLILPTTLPSFAAGDILVQMGGFHLYMDGSWYLSHGQNLFEKLFQQPNPIIYPSQILTHPTFSEYLEKNHITVDPSKTSRYDDFIKATEQQQTPGELPELLDLFPTNPK